MDARRVDADARHAGVDPDEGGFTLVELMVAVLIIGLLIAIALPTFLGARTRAQDRAAQSELRTGLAAALTHYAQAGDWTAFDAAQAEVAEPVLTWVDGGPPGPREIAIPVHFGGQLVLVRQSGSGTYFCVAQVPLSPATARGRGIAFSDVDTAAECAGGW